MDSKTRAILEEEDKQDFTLQSYNNNKLQEELLADEFWCDEEQCVKSWSEIDQQLYVTDLLYNDYIEDRRVNEELTCGICGLHLFFAPACACEKDMATFCLVCDYSPCQCKHKVKGVM